MMNLLKNPKGMSLTEAIVVILIISLLTTASIPAFFYIRNKRFEREMIQLVSKLKANLIAEQTRKIILDNIDEGFPKQLDSNNYPAPCEQCFTVSFTKGIQNSLWYKHSETEYFFSRNGNFDHPEDYWEKNDYKMTYSPQNGKIELEQIE